MKNTLGIAFGGSGAEGIAGIAYIKALEDLNVKPDIVSGTGVGGVIAAMYAAGMTSEDMISFLENVSFPGEKRPINIKKIKDAKYGILDGIGLEEYFQMIMPVKVFDRLYFKLKIVAANYSSGEQIIFSDGNVGPAVRAGVSVPGIFSPYEKEETFYIDGSCVNPVPFDIIRNDCDVLVAFDPYINQAIDENGFSLNVFPAFMSAFEASKKSLVNEKKIACKPDIFERINIENITMFDFALYEQILASFEEKTEVFKNTLSNLLK